MAKLLDINDKNKGYYRRLISLNTIYSYEELIKELMKTNMKEDKKATLYDVIYTANHMGIKSRRFLQALYYSVLVDGEKDIDKLDNGVFVILNYYSMFNEDIENKRFHSDKVQLYRIETNYKDNFDKTYVWLTDKKSLNNYRDKVEGFYVRAKVKKEFLIDVHPEGKGAVVVDPKGLEIVENGFIYPFIHDDIQRAMIRGYRTPSEYIPYLVIQNVTKDKKTLRAVTKHMNTLLSEYANLLKTVDSEDIFKVVDVLNKQERKLIEGFSNTTIVRILYYITVVTQNRIPYDKDKYVVSLIRSLRDRGIY